MSGKVNQMIEAVLNGEDACEVVNEAMDPLAQVEASLKQLGATVTREKNGLKFRNVRLHSK